jgi:hypothetical protein
MGGGGEIGVLWIVMLSQLISKLFKVRSNGNTFQYKVKNKHFKIVCPSVEKYE